MSITETEVTRIPTLERVVKDLFAEITADAAIPVITDRPQMQGDLIVLPLHMAHTASFGVLRPVGEDGEVLIPEGRGGHVHRLVAANPGDVLYGPEMTGRQRGNIGVAYITGTAYVLHHDGSFVKGDHGALALGPGYFCFRRQRETVPGMGLGIRWRMVAD